jgi:tRNA (pseudouridine54-N1)-methyltransferase
MDVIVRAVNSALFLSHGIRKDADITIHLMGKPGQPRRIWFNGSRLRGVHPDERAIAGQIGKVLIEPTPARGQWIELHPGLWHSGGDISHTLQEWEREKVTMFKLDAEAEQFLFQDGGGIPHRLGYFLSDDQPFLESENQLLDARMSAVSLGENWIQGHIAIGVVHHLLDNIKAN